MAQDTVLITSKKKTPQGCVDEQRAYLLISQNFNGEYYSHIMMTPGGQYICKPCVLAC